MPVITVKESGDFSKSETFLKRMLHTDFASKLAPYGERGVAALYEATPYSSGETARSWRYEIEASKERVVISWTNDYAPRGIQVAILLQYGHATKSGGWVDGVDYINPALAPIFEEIENDLWREVTR
jgi:hypothetical protein